MSDQQPPTGPGPSYGPPPGGFPPPPSGPPPGGFPPPPGASGGPKKGRKGLAIGAGVVAAVVIIGGGAVAAVKLAGSGDSAGAAEALPADTFAFAGLDLTEDQLKEAAKLALKFPGISKDLDLKAGGDIREQLITQIIDESDDCKLAESDFDWAGDQAGMAGVVVDDKPQPVLVMQTTDGDAAKAAFKKFDQCDGESGDAAYAISGDWAIVAPEKKIVDTVVDGADKSNLADDSDFGDWMDKVGDPGILSFYASKDAGKQIGELMKSEMGSSSMGDLEGLDGMEGDMGGMGSFNPFADICPGLMDPSASAEAAAAQYEKFAGAAGQVRVTDGGLEMEVVADTGSDTPAVGDGAGALVESLPSSTGAALGVAAKKGWYDAALANFGAVCGDDFDPDKITEMLSGVTGLDIPTDLETLTGDALALSVDGSISPSALSSPDDMKAGLKIKGDASGIEGVVGDIRTRLEGMGADDYGVLDTDTDGDFAAIGPSASYRKKLLEDGGLGKDATFQNVVPEADKAGAILFVNFNQLDDLVKLADDDEVSDNFGPLDGFGLSSWTEGSEQHGFLRLSTDK